MSIATKLAKLKTIKQDIKSALEEKGQTPSNVFSTYANNIRAIETGGGSGEITIPSVTNLVVSEKGIATWNAPDITSLAAYNPVISYLVSVNGNEAIETNDTTLNLRLVLQDGSNTISVVVKALLTNNKDTSTTIEYSKHTETITTLSTKLPSVNYGASAAAVGNNIYIFGGKDSSILKTIFKFDTTTETITTLEKTLPEELYASSAAAVGNNIYIFGGKTIIVSKEVIRNTIYKFDTTTETITTLSEKLNDTIFGHSAIAVGTKIYILGGENDNSSNFTTTLKKFDSENLTISSEVFYLYKSFMSAELVGEYIYLFGGYSLSGGTYVQSDSIYRFDTNTETFTCLNQTLPSMLSYTSSALIGTNVYIFGGYSPNTSDTNTILKFNTITEKITTLEITLPNACRYTSAVAVNNAAYIFGGTYFKNSEFKRLNTILKLLP